MLTFTAYFGKILSQNVFHHLTVYTESGYDSVGLVGIDLHKDQQEKQLHFYWKNIGIENHFDWSCLL
jgi:hypothetical protein